MKDSIELPKTKDELEKVRAFLQCKKSEILTTLFLYGYAEIKTSTDPEKRAIAIRVEPKIQTPKGRRTKKWFQELKRLRNLISGN